ncbi:hypothetical protein [Streptomyces sp. NRRL B-24484]|uniref:hypothetical protein n=1 Tax=Streptomyces sp. NRRL B-24484 TaxID=1463833 RepID=UPI0004BE5533|nr:hypothetical protein [Streptomyces sp. NRRL B-24484]
MVHPAHPRRIVTRLVDGAVCAYDLTAGAMGVLTPAAVFRPHDEDEAVSHAVSADLRRAYYATLDAVVCVTAEGAELWRSEFAPRSEERFGHRPGCALSSDGGLLWVYRPDAMAGRNRPDQWVAVDAGTGATVARADLQTVGHGGSHLLHPADGRMLLDVGEGQDGTVIHRASVADGRMELFGYPWTDRCLMDLSPDGRHFMTVDHEQADVAVHGYPGGDVGFTLTVDAFGHDPEEVCVEWSGGYLTPDTLVVTLIGETEDEEEWFRRYRVDAHAGRVLAPFDARSENPYDFTPLGDGTWLTTDPSGHPVRRTDS